jgi:hypothetical protein
LRFEGTSVSKKYEAGFLFLSNAPPPPRKDGGDKNTETSFEEETLESSPMTESDITRLLGVKHGVESACGVADGVLHPMTLQPYRALPTNGAPRCGAFPTPNPKTVYCSVWSTVGKYYPLRVLFTIPHTHGPKD